MPDKQRTFGQYETPPDVADLLLGFCLRRPTDRLLDPSCGAGAFLRRAALWQTWLADTTADILPDTLWGAELDTETAAIAHANLPQARILNQNFFTLQPEPGRPFDAIIGNPPYTRAEWISHLDREAGRQLTMFDWPAQEKPTGQKQAMVPRKSWRSLSRRSGLHAYFFLHSAPFLREGGRLGFVMPNGWLDVAYGEGFKYFLLGHFKVIALIESSVERWFRQAKVNTCLVVLEKCSDPALRALNLVRLVHLKRSLGELIPYPVDDYRRPQAIEQLATRLLPNNSRQTGDFAVGLVPQGELQAGARWGQRLRAPTIYRPRQQQEDLPPLKKWATVQRGFTTGANGFFYLDSATIARWEIEPEFRRPVLKSLRGIHQLRLTVAACRHELLWAPPTADLRHTAVSRYIAWGESQGYHLRRSCAARQPWYSLPARLSEPSQPVGGAAALLLPKGIWRRHFAPLLADAFAVDQQLYQIGLSAGVSLLAAAALLNSAWFALQCELQGRVNLGEGVLWLATYEVGEVCLPDLRRLSPTDSAELARLFTPLGQRPLQESEIELALPERQALDAAVFDLLGFSTTERSAVVEALLERLDTRQRRARG